jgi:hypothetical protein
MTTFKAITIQVFGESPAIYQHVHGWPMEVEPGILEVEIRIPLFFQPSDIETDVREALNSNGFKDYKLSKVISEQYTNFTA